MTKLLFLETIHCEQKNDDKWIVVRSPDTKYRTLGAHCVWF